MLLVVGLGNPGPQYERTRHNVGFLVLATLRTAAVVAEPRARFAGLFVRGEIAGRPVALLEPQTFMNLSGESVRAAAAFLKVPAADIVVVHDELDLPWQDIRLKSGGGHAGHNGLRSVIDCLGTPDFVRVRVGVGLPPATLIDRQEPFGAGQGPRESTSAEQGPRETTRLRRVLETFSSAESAELPQVLARATDVVTRVVSDGIESAMQSVNTRR